ncbi:MAG: hypothetical protein KKE76_03275 [Gammaproteobacteria bacterium]|nr:hypothetical protein [Gammaproteobacteria bacterium]
MNCRRRGCWILLFGTVLIIAMSGVWQRPADEVLPTEPLPLLAAAECDSAQAACVARGEGFALELSLGPPVQPMQPFGIQLRILQGQLSSDATVVLQFQMQDMDMGQNRYRLIADEQSVWRGTAVLPVCSRGRSDWFAQIDIQDGERRWSAELPFTVIAQQ